MSDPVLIREDGLFLYTLPAGVVVNELVTVDGRSLRLTTPHGQELVGRNHGAHITKPRPQEVRNFGH